VTTRRAVWLLAVATLVLASLSVSQLASATTTGGTTTTSGATTTTKHGPTTTVKDTTTTTGATTTSSVAGTGLVCSEHLDQRPAALHRRQYRALAVRGPCPARTWGGEPVRRGASTPGIAGRIVLPREGVGEGGRSAPALADSVSPDDGGLG
jgi:hypothetical protein